jgi:putative sigma-54 modulation protein
MEIDVRLRGIEATAGLRGNVKRVLMGALSRFGSALSHAVVRLTDINGPDGGDDKQCRIEVHGARIGQVVIEERHAKVEAAVARAAERAAFSVGRSIERLRAKKTRGRARTRRGEG